MGQGGEGKAGTEVEVRKIRMERRGQAGEEVRGSSEEPKGLGRTEEDCVAVRHARGGSGGGRLKSNHSEGQGKGCLGIINT